MTKQTNNTNTVVLDTGLFSDRETVTNALTQLNLPESSWHKLTPETMNDGDWDQILNLVLSATRVITV